MKLLDTVNLQDKQKFSWGEISWLHEPIDSPHGRLSVAQVKLYPGCQQEKHYHLGEEQLFYVVQGQGIFITNGEKRNIQEPMVVYIPPHSEHEVLNTGKEDLIFIVAYVPMKLIELQKPYTVAKHRNIQDLIPIEVLQSIKEQLSELLKMTIHICDKNHGLLTRDKEENDFCKICSSIEGCSKRRYASDSANQLSDKMYRCAYDLIELEIPININENILGYIKSGNFILSNSKDIEKKIYKIGEKTGIAPHLILESYKKIPSIIKSRIYVIQEHLVIAAQFIQVMLERSIMEDELLEKDNEILIRTKEKIELKDALKKANSKIYQDKIFAGSLNVTREIFYPYDMEILLEEAIKEGSLVKIEKIIEDYKDRYNGEDIVQEMIIVLSRTTLRDLESIEVIADIRKKYNRSLLQTKKEDPWEYFKGFCRDCVEAHEKALESNGRELIDRINTYIQNHYKEDLNLNRIAEVFYISPNYLSTLFNEKNHMSFRDYLQNLRIEEGKRYLRVTTAKVNDVAKKVGYKNTSYFVNVFRKNVGMTPNEYRKSSIKSSL